MISNRKLQVLIFSRLGKKKSEKKLREVAPLGAHKPELATPILGLSVTAFLDLFTDLFILRPILGHIFPRK